MKQKNWSFFLILLLCTACASKNFKEPEVSGPSSRSVQKIFSKSYNDVWSAVTSALSVKKYAIAESKRDHGILVTDWISGKSERLFSGYGDTRIPYTIRYKLRLHISTSKKGVKVLIQNEEQYYSDSVTAGTDFNGSLYQWIPTKGSGTKEIALLEEIEQQLSSYKGKQK